MSHRLHSMMVYPPPPPLWNLVICGNLVICCNLNFTKRKYAEHFEFPKKKFLGWSSGYTIMLCRRWLIYAAFNLYDSHWLHYYFNYLCLELIFFFCKIQLTTDYPLLNIHLQKKMIYNFRDRDHAPLPHI